MAITALLGTPRGSDTPPPITPTFTPTIADPRSGQRRGCCHAVTGCQHCGVQ